MNIQIEFKNNELKGKVNLPASKSISNRVLIIHELSGNEKAVENVSDCEDTRRMLEVLGSASDRFDVGHAGTAMRFLTAFLARRPGVWEITGSERMKQRPVKILAEALNRLGARIEYAGQEGFPPLRIYGSVLKGGELEISGAVSSQYISALLMIAPSMEKGLTLRLKDKTVSRTYIEMTVAIMREFGALVEIEESLIRVKPGGYVPVPYRVESDWSGASYFYELLALAAEGELVLEGLKEKSLQGDARQQDVWDRLGITTRFEGEKVILRKKACGISRLDWDFIEMPDLVQSFAVACCLKGIPFVFSGVETLRIKETDRISALIEELGKLGFRVKAGENHRLIWEGERCAVRSTEIATYQDHRMAMAFAPAALVYPGLLIQDQEVVRKSFPFYWEELGKLGARIKIE